MVMFAQILWLQNESQEALDINCTTVFSVNNKELKFSSSLNGFFAFRPNGTGYSELAGNATSGDFNHVISRGVTFDYEKQSSNTYILKSLKLVKHTSDTADDDLMDRAFFSMSNEPYRYMSLYKIKNGFIMGNLHSPVLVCVTK
ncbi:hypothetical protein [Enterobacter sp. CP102]|uniref:hypothetical protein n=1 Tax=Enterobacter sp. CP102 TaxID=2976431 RepID=UPI002206928C|nr:hypothetical protein [Enterobacter sp. CP102]UWM63221.1 hypothetical protein N1249_16925 [Enterobacter sp. CP102]